MNDTLFKTNLGSVKVILNSQPLSKEQKDILEPLVKNVFPTQTEFIPKFPVFSLKKWDVIFSKHGAVPTPHFHIVLKVIKDKVYCLTVTSEPQPFADLEITKSRQLKGYICNTITILPLKDCLNRFVFVYDGAKKEISSIFSSIMQQLNQL